MKTCFKCNRELPLTEFYPHPQMKDGHLNKCKECAKRDTAERVVSRSSDLDWLESEKARHREKARRYRASGRQKPQSTEKKRETGRKHAAKYPERHLARKMVAHAVKAGLLKRQPCQECGSTDSEAHHDDYSQPLAVLWLCPKHHAARHVELRKLQRQNNHPCRN